MAVVSLQATMCDGAYVYGYENYFTKIFCSSDQPPHGHNIVPRCKCAFSGIVWPWPVKCTADTYHWLFLYVICMLNAVTTYRCLHDLFTVLLAIQRFVVFKQIHLCLLSSNYNIQASSNSCSSDSINVSLPSGGVDSRCDVNMHFLCNGRCDNFTEVSQKYRLPSCAEVLRMSYFLVLLCAVRHTASQIQFKPLLHLFKFVD
jgi:hypothetical protein